MACIAFGDYSREMPRPTLNHLKWFALLFGLFFALTSALQYAFESHISKAEIRADLADQATNVSAAADYRDGVDPSRYFMAYVDAEDYVVILKDGSILDVNLGKNRPLRQALPRVSCPILTDAAFNAPVWIPYHTERDRASFLAKYGDLRNWTYAAG